jgi:hypothetical protein
MQVMQSCAVPGLRYIADGAAPLVPKPWVEQSLVAHSPDDSKYKEYLKPRGHEKGPLWMPFWEPDELEALRAKHFAKEVSSVEVGLHSAYQDSTRLGWLWQWMQVLHIFPLQ